MTTATETLWQRIRDRIVRFENMLDYDSTQYTYDQLDELNKKIGKLAERVEALEFVSSSSRKAS